MKNLRKSKGIWVVILIYALAGGLWILFSDQLLLMIAKDMESYKTMQTYKGWFYVFITSVLLYSLLKGYAWRLEKYERELNIKEKALIESEKKYRDIVDNVQSVIVISSLDGKIKFINKFGENFFGFSQEELVGKDLVGTIVPEVESTGRNLRELIEDVFKRPDMYVQNINENTKRDGQRVWIFWVNKLVSDEEGKPKELLSIGTDITELKKAHEELERYKAHLEELVEARTKELEEANEKLKELDRLKSMFIASMSHELRTPLNSIIGFSSIILNEWLGPLNEEQKENIATINRAGKHLLALINDVIDISKIEAGVIDINITEFDSSEVIEEATKIIEEELKKKGVELRQDVKNYRLFTDRRRLFQCVLNLLSNAAKFTERGWVSIMLSEDESNPDFIKIVVEDTGVGIKEEDQKKLFKPFQRFEGKERGKIPGTGLGLYLTKKILQEVLKGDIIVSSHYGKGSRFEIRVPKRLG